VERIGEHSPAQPAHAAAAEHRHAGARAARLLSSHRPAAPSPPAPPASSLHRSSQATSTSDIAAEEFGFEGQAAAPARPRAGGSSPAPAATAAATEFGG
jgi:hypothetical protein